MPDLLNALPSPHSYRVLKAVSSLTGGGLMTALHPNQDDSHAARRQRWACNRCGEKPLSEEIDLYFATGLCSWCSHLFAKDDYAGDPARAGRHRGLTARGGYSTAF